MAAQRRGRRDTKNEVETGFSAPIDDLGTTIMAVGAQQDLRPRPVAADRPQKPAQESADFAAVRSFGRPQHGRDKAAVTIEDDNRLEAILVVMGIEQP